MKDPIDELMERRYLELLTRKHNERMDAIWARLGLQREAERESEAAYLKALSKEVFGDAP